MAFNARLGRFVETTVAGGIVEEITGRQRGRVFAYGAYLAILNEGTSPLGGY